MIPQYIFNLQQTLSSSADEVRMDSAPLEAASVLSESGASPSSNSKHSRSHSTSDFYVTPVSSPPPSPDLPHPRERRIKDRIKVADADEGRRHHTFFSSLSVKFEDMEVEDGDFIPTQPFLQRCQLLLPFFGVCVCVCVCVCLLYVCVSMYECVSVCV